MPAKHQVLFWCFCPSQTKSSNKSEENKKLSRFLLTVGSLVEPNSRFSSEVVWVVKPPSSFRPPPSSQLNNRPNINKEMLVSQGGRGRQLECVREKIIWHESSWGPRGGTTPGNRGNVGQKRGWRCYNNLRCIRKRRRVKHTAIATGHGSQYFKEKMEYFARSEKKIVAIVVGIPPTIQPRNKPI